MSLKDVEDLIDEAVKKGAVHATLYLEAQGLDEEVLKGTLISTIKKITNFPGTIYGEGEIEKVLKQDEIYTTFAEVEIVVADLRTLINIVLNFGPSAVEIQKPDEFKLSAGEAQIILADMSSVVNGFAEYILTGAAEKNILPGLSKIINEAKQEINNVTKNDKGENKKWETLLRLFIVNIHC